MTKGKQVNIPAGKLATGNGCADYETSNLRRWTIAPA